MCGIAGILHCNRQPVACSQLKAMTDSIAHRGPDGEGQWVNEYVGLGHRRLAIIDLTPAGNQPMQTRNGRYVITYNGEVYNFKEIRTELESLGYQFRSDTDSEVVVNAFAEWKEECLNRFNGMFAFAVWDNEEKQLFLARDRYGIKPLYYYIDSNSVVFASEVKAIIHSGQYRPEMDKEGLVEYLTFQNFFTDRTLFQGVRILRPGHFMYVDAQGNTKKEKYWDFCFSPVPALSEKEATEELDRLFRQAVQRQLISDVPVNSYLSGGIDSGAITVMASSMLPDMKTFTVGFDLSSASGLELSFDEREKAEHLSYIAKTEHYEMVLKAGDMERCMRPYVWHLEEPRVGQSYPNYYAAGLASKFGKVVLSGCGGDELFAGYPWRYFYTDCALDFDTFVDQYYCGKWQRLLPNSQLKKLIRPFEEEVQDVWTRDIFAEVLSSVRQENFFPDSCLNRSLYLEAKTFLHGLLVVEDKLSMAHSLETRVPFLDNDLVDFALQLPDALRVTKETTFVNENDKQTKHRAYNNGKTILRKTLSRYLGNSISQLKKQGFSSPDASWFRGESLDYVTEKLSTPSPLFDHDIVQGILKEHCCAYKNNRLLIWSLLYIRHFREIFL